MFAQVKREKCNENVNRSSAIFNCSPSMIKAEADLLKAHCVSRVFFGSPAVRTRTYGSDARRKPGRGLENRCTTGQKTQCLLPGV